MFFEVGQPSSIPGFGVGVQANDRHSTVPGRNGDFASLRDVTFALRRQATVFVS